MKKINSVLLSMIFIAGTLNASFLPTPNPYSIGPDGRSVDSLKFYSPPNRNYHILPNRPLIATDSSGNRLCFTPTGKLAASYSKDGKFTFTLGNVTKTTDAEGNLTGVSRVVKGTNMVEVRNEFGEVLSYQELGFGGKVVAAYDNEKNLTATYYYDKYGKGIDRIVNEMTKGMTVFDQNTGLAMYDIDYEGNRVGRYIYDDKNRLAEKVDVYGNTTYFDDNGNPTHTSDKDGLVISRYNYKYDDKENYVLENVTDPRTGNITYFDVNGKQTVTKNAFGAVIHDFLWMGSKLIATFDRQSQETTWYSVDGKTMYTTFNDEVISKHLFFEGQLVGIWNVRTNQVTVLKNERQELVLQLGNGPTYPTELTTLVRCTDESGSGVVLSLKDFQAQSDLGKVFEKVEEFAGYVLKSDENGHIVEYEPVIEPSAGQIKKWIDEGLVDKKYLFNPL